MLGEKNPQALLVGMQTGAAQPLWKEVWSYVKKLKMKLPYGPASLLAAEKLVLGIRDKLGQNLVSHLRTSVWLDRIPSQGTQIIRENLFRKLQR